MTDQSPSLPHTVWIPPLHHDLTVGAERVEACGATIRAVLADLDGYPLLSRSPHPPTIW